MLTRLCLCFVLGFPTAISSLAADEPPPTLRPDPAAQPAIEKSFKINLLRDTHDPTESSPVSLSRIFYFSANKWRPRALG